MGRHGVPEHGSGTPADEGRRKRRRLEPSPAQRALGLLVRREHSRKELANKLAARGVAREDAEAAVERMAAEGWQDDARFATSRSEEQTSELQSLMRNSYAVFCLK